MHLTCPTCFNQHSLDAMLELGMSKEVTVAVARVPGGMGTLVLRYLSLFRKKGKGVSAEKACKLITEIADMMTDATVRKHGRDWVAPLDDWRAAMEMLIDPETRPPTLDLPLKSNQYLIGILTKKANTAEAKAENKREAERAKRTIVGGHASHAIASLPRPVGEHTQPPPPAGEGGGGLAAKVAAINAAQSHPMDAIFDGVLVKAPTAQLPSPSPQPSPTGRGGKTATRAGLINVRDVIPANIAARMGKVAPQDEPHPWLNKPVRILTGQHKGREGTCIEIKANTAVVRIVQPRIGERVLVFPFDQLEVL